VAEISAAYLRKPTSPKWEEHYADFNLILTKVASSLHQAGIPLILVALPSREEASLYMLVGATIVLSIWESAPAYLLSFQVNREPVITSSTRELP
jgi:hypothetical protein